MSAQHIFDDAPLGSLVRYSDGQPRPPARFTRKLAAWERSNGVGRLIKKSPAVQRPTYAMPAGFTLHIGDFGGGGIVLIVLTMTYQITSALQFEIVERPAAGMVRVLTEWEGIDELRHLALDLPTAEAWLAAHHYSNARFELIPDDEAAPGPLMIGRAA